jgi:hypothetical protein
MNKDPIRGKTIRWTFSDGPMANKTFEHTFDENGTVTWRMLDDNGEGKASEPEKYESVDVGSDIRAISYLGSSGYTLTVVLDFRTGKLAAFASNEKGLTVQRGTFEKKGDVQHSPRKGGHRSKSAHAH